ncbi:serine acetyltransferase [Mucilaginibacter sp. CSA2-8R]|uniref:serine O-acetyltransferase n=1 Tax=Mucilaginibacter sp. CSA2-8R TaxID=3141542 RepID=UPI00315C659E
MDEDFYSHLFEKQGKALNIPPNSQIAKWAMAVVHLLFPEQSKRHFKSVDDLKTAFTELEQELAIILQFNDANHHNSSADIAAAFFAQVPDLYRILNTDIKAIYEGDPAAFSEFEVIRSYPGLFAISLYRIAHQLCRLGVPLIPRILTEYAHSKTGIDIHPSAKIGEYFHIDHGTGVVIGESCTIGNHVKIYQGVTLGALSVRKSMAGTKRHPTVQDRVVIYSGATILGGETIIGHDSVIGGNVWLTDSVAPHSTVYHTPMISVQNIISKS